MKRFLFVHILPYFVWQNEHTGKYEIVNNWRTDVIEVFAKSEEFAKELIGSMGIKEGVDYHDILEFKGYV